MEAEHTLSLASKILKLLSKLKCKIMCCCKSSCTMDGSEPETIETITEL